MRDVSVEHSKRLKTKIVYSVRYKGRDTGVVAKEVFYNGMIKWYPFYVSQSDGKVTAKYTSLKYIATKNKKYPSAGFSVNDSTGYGFTSAQGVNSFFRYLDKIGKISAIIFVTEKTTLTDDGVFEISFSDFAKIRSSAKTFSDSKKNEEEHLIKSVLNRLLPDSFQEPGKLMYFPGNLQRFVDKYSVDTIHVSNSEAHLLKNILLGSDISADLMVSTRREIERVYIEDVLSKYKKLMCLKGDSKSLEEKWHKFFREHTWIFSQIFAFPAVFFKDKVNLGGQDFSGSTDKIVDFLYKNEFTNNLAFIEIKTHKTSLVNKSPYRKPDIFSISKDVTGAIVQVMDQRTKLLKNYNSKRGDEPIESLNSHCLIVVGELESLKSNKHKQASFELFRSGNKEVTIITFDELLSKVSTLLEIFTRSAN